MSKITLKQLVQQWAREVHASADRAEVEQRLGVDLGSRVPVPARCLDSAGAVTGELDFHIERTQLPSGGLKVTVTTSDRGTAAEIRKLWFAGPDRRQGGTAHVAIPVEQKADGRGLTIVLSERAVKNAPTDLQKAMPTAVDIVLAPAWERALRDLKCLMGLDAQTEAIQGLRLAPAGVRAATDVDEPLDQGETECAGTRVTWALYTDGHVRLTFEGEGLEDEGKVIRFAVNALTPDGTPLRNAYAVLVKSPLSENPSASFEFSSTDLKLDEDHMASAGDAPTAEDLPAMQWSLEHATGAALKKALNDLAASITSGEAVDRGQAPPAQRE